jgi:hypothetical protein
MFPADYTPNAPCVNYDPCIGGTTLWTVSPCTVAVIGEPAVITATTVPATAPTGLPATGNPTGLGLALAATLVVAGVIARRAGRTETGK